MGEGGNQLIPEYVHINPANGSQSPFLGAGRATTAIWHRTKNHDPPTQLEGQSTSKALKATRSISNKYLMTVIFSAYRNTGYYL
jgi:hypothetical protein